MLRVTLGLVLSPHDPSPFLLRRDMDCQNRLWAVAHLAYEAGKRFGADMAVHTVDVEEIEGGE